MFLPQGNDLIPNKVYEDAQALLDVGTDIEEVRQKTGITVGLGGELLFEISDKDATVNQYKANLAARGITGGKIDVLWHKRKPDGMFDVTMRIQSQDGLWITESYDFEEETVIERFPHDTAKSILAGEGEPYNGNYMSDGLRLGSTFMLPLTSTYLHEILNHDALYEAYPSLRYLEVRQLTHHESGTFAQYVTKQDGRVFLELGLSYDYEHIKKCILHETQHRIQDITKLPQGSETIRYKKVSPNHYYVSITQAKINSILESNPEAKTTFGELQEFMDSLRTQYPDSEDASIFNLYEHLDEDAADTIFDKLSELRERLPEKLHDLLHTLESLLTDVKAPLNPSDIYRNSAGEIESKTVEIRSNLSQEELAAKAPYTDHQRGHANVYYDRKEDLSMMADYNLAKSTQLHLNLRKQCEPFAKVLLDDQLSNVDITGHVTEAFLFIYQDLYRKLPNDNPICRDFEDICRWGGQTYDFHLNMMISKSFHEAFNDFIAHGASTNPSLNNAFGILKKWIKNTILLLTKSAFYDESLNEQIFPVLDRMYSAKPPASPLQREIQKEILAASKVDSDELAKAVAIAIDCGYETLSQKAGIPKEKLIDEYGIKFMPKPIDENNTKKPRFGLPQN